MKIKNFATTRSMIPTVQVSGKSLVYRKKVANDWTNVPIENPFALDLPSLQHGWIKFEKGRRSEPLTQPASTPWSDNEANAMITDGHIFVVTAKMSSAEIGGLHELIVTDGNVINTINELADSYLSHPSASLGEIPVVSHQINEMANHSFIIRGFMKRHSDFGKAVNPMPQPAPEPEPEPKPEMDKAARLRALLIERVELKKSQGQKQLAH